MSYFTQVNWIAVVLGAVLYMIVGFIWYGPLFGRLWLRVIGKREEELRSSADKYILSFLAALVSSYILAVLIEGLDISVWWQGMLMGAVVWIGIGATATLANGLFEESSKGAWLLFTFYQLILYLAEGSVFAVWKL